MHNAKTRYKHAVIGIQSPWKKGKEDLEGDEYLQLYFQWVATSQTIYFTSMLFVNKWILSLNETDNVILDVLKIHCLNTCKWPTSDNFSYWLQTAFDTVDHEIRLQRLQSSYSIHGSVLQWFRSCLLGRNQCVRRGSARSSTVPLGVVLWWAWANPSCVPNFSHCVNIEGNPKYWGAPPRATPILSSACDFMMGLGKP